MVFDSPAHSSALLDSAPWAEHADEIALLLACARTVVQPEDLRRHLARDLDWSVILDQAARHGIDPMVYHHLGQLEGTELPPSVEEELQSRGEGMLAYNLHRLRALGAVVEVLEEAGIPVLSFKGPLLARRYYNNLAFRRFLDLDLLVPRSQLRQAEALLKRHAFEGPELRSDEEVTKRIEDQIGLELIRPEDNLQVELHWALLNRSFAFPLSPEGIWARCQRCEIGETAVRVLSKEDELLYLCAHGTKHHWARLKWICDVAEMCRHASDLDWDGLVDRAVRLDLERILFLGLRLAKECLDAPVPTSLHERLYGDSTISDLAHWVQKRWLFTEEGLDRTPRWEQFRFFLRTRRRWRNRWPLLREYGGLALTPTEKDRALIDLPPSLSFLYYLIRPFRILGLGAQTREEASAQ